MIFNNIYLFLLINTFYDTTNLFKFVNREYFVGGIAEVCVDPDYR